MFAAAPLRRAFALVLTGLLLALLPVWSGAAAAAPVPGWHAVALSAGGRSHQSSRPLVEHVAEPATRKEPTGGPKHATKGGSRPAATKGGSKPAATKGGSQPAATKGGSQPAATKGGSQPAAAKGGSQPAATKATSGPAAAAPEAKSAAAPAVAPASTSSPASGLGGVVAALGGGVVGTLNSVTGVVLNGPLLGGVRTLLTSVVGGSRTPAPTPPPSPAPSNPAPGSPGSVTSGNVVAPPSPSGGANSVPRSGSTTQAVTAPAPTPAPAPSSRPTPKSPRAAVFLPGSVNDYLVTTVIGFVVLAVLWMLWAALIRPILGR